MVYGYRRLLFMLQNTKSRLSCNLFSAKQEHGPDHYLPTKALTTLQTCHEQKIVLSLLHLFFDFNDLKEEAEQGLSGPPLLAAYP